MLIQFFWGTLSKVLFTGSLVFRVAQVMFEATAYLAMLIADHLEDVSNE